MVSNFWQKASGSIAKFDFQFSIRFLRGDSNEKSMKLEAKCYWFLRQYIFYKGVETEFYLSRGIVEEIFLLNKKTFSDKF